jgi:hypothetical protein
MPFNEKGEFIRSSGGTSSSVTAADASSPLWSLENLCLLAMGIGALVLLAGLIWLVIHYWELIVCICVALAALKLRHRR